MQFNFIKVVCELSLRKKKIKHPEEFWIQYIRRVLRG